jgi:hypothetical protein
MWSTTTKKTAPIRIDTPSITNSIHFGHGISIILASPYLRKFAGINFRRWYLHTAKLAFDGHATLVGMNALLRLTFRADSLELHGPPSDMLKYNALKNNAHGETLSLLRFTARD